MAGPAPAFPPALHKLADSYFARADDRIVGLPTPNLTVSIHPLFHFSNFHGLTPRDYTELRPALQLATQMLYDDRATFYIVGMADGSLHALDTQNRMSPDLNPLLLTGTALDNVQLIRMPRPPMGPVPMGSRVNAGTRFRSREILANLCLVLNQIQVVAPGAEGDFTHLSTVRGSPGRFGIFPAMPDRQVDIVLRRDRVDNIRKYSQQPQLALAHHAHLARTIVHEVAHMLSIAVHGHRALRDKDVFFSDMCCNEAGFNLETILFGGVVHICNLNEYLGRSGEDTHVLNLQYPSKKFVDIYISNGDPIGQRWPVDGYLTATRIPWQFGAAMFTQHFWDHVVPSMGNGPIRPLVLSSWVFRLVKAGDVYITELGVSVTASESGIVPCSLGDPTLPPRVLIELYNMVNVQQRLG